MDFYGAAYSLPVSKLNDRIDELIAQLKLSDFLDRQTRLLPVGWRQRLALAAALLHQPKILFLDEPTGGVDPVFRRQFWSILYKLAEEGVTLFVTTHYMDEAEYCGRISIMHSGKIIELGKPEDIVKKHGGTNLEDTFIDLINRRGAADE